MKGVGRVRVARARIVGALGEEMRVFNHGGVIYHSSGGPRTPRGEEKHLDGSSTYL